MTIQPKETAVYVAFEDYVPHDPAQPERELLRALLMNALSDLRKAGDVARKAREYFLSPEDDYIFSFTSVCSHLNVDPNRILLIAGLGPESAPAAAAAERGADSEAVPEPAAPESGGEPA